VDRVSASEAEGRGFDPRQPHQNTKLEVHPANSTNDPYIAGQNSQLMAINASRQVDLQGQCGSESIAQLKKRGTWFQCPEKLSTCGCASSRALIW
jgi:acyl-CoA hydrolase